MFDVASDREQRRETRGYVAPTQARAFLEASRRLRFRPDTAPPVDPIARAHLENRRSSGRDGRPRRTRATPGRNTTRSLTIMPNRSRPSSKSCATQASSRRSLARCSLRRTLTLRACNTSRRTCSSCSSATTWSLRRGTTSSPFSQTRSRQVAPCRHAHFRQRKRGMPLRLSAISGSRTGRRTGSPRRSAAPSRTPGRRCPTIFYSATISSPCFKWDGRSFTTTSSWTSQSSCSMSSPRSVATTRDSERPRRVADSS